MERGGSRGGDGGGAVGSPGRRSGGAAPATWPASPPTGRRGLGGGAAGAVGGGGGGAVRQEGSGGGTTVRLRGTAVSAVACAAIAVSYLSWRLPAGRAPPGPLRNGPVAALGHVGRGLAAALGSVHRGLGGIGAVLIRRSRDGDGASTGPIFSGGAGHSVRRVMLPPHQATSAADAAAAADVSPPGDAIEVRLVSLPALTPAAAAAALAGLAAAADDGGDGGAVLGLDAEWETEVLPGVRHRISVLQLSTANCCWVIQTGGGTYALPPPADPHDALTASSASTPSVASASAEPTRAHAGPDQAQAGPSLPDCVVALLQDPRVIKAGVGIQEDVRRLERDFGVQVRGAVDVRLVAQRVAPAALAAGGSLAALAAALLGRGLDKGPQRSRWGAPRLEERQAREGLSSALTPAQIAYAAHDAWLGRELLLELYRRHVAAAGATAAAAAVAAAPAVAAAAMATATAAAAAPPAAPGLLAFAAPFRDVFTGFKNNKLKQALGAADATAAARLGGSVPGAGAGGGGGGGGGGRVKPLKEHSLPTRKSVLYENCRLLAPDGAVLCTCGEKKVRWYLSRGLADVVSGGQGDGPLVVKLKFEPRGRGHADDHYYLADKQNRCCVCGAGGEYLRHSVVPHCYRQWFPVTMKSHLSHDIVLMCPPCHKACGAADQRRMADLGRRYGAPLAAASAAKVRRDSVLDKVRSAGRALANPKVTIPAPRRAELEAVVMAHFDVDQLTAEHVAAACQVEPRSEDENWQGHAEAVVKAVQAEGGRGAVEAFIRGWRQHFLDAMAPNCMPPHWRVDARVANSADPEPEPDSGPGQDLEPDLDLDSEPGTEAEAEVEG
ncbi:hypothetical protein HYH03_011091 [Edaphochlamys debaryana]|uniref:3'-5' exonuclease domain-containing protein n=1 Tax=Edaphochlamys debaryana TaxID=47281 RepID=A0A835XVA4_9CHLO|nr:hypothetical protein HYH03_011091 [Edaphochlamys debaryana]|eukprot:KAG2490455.1 hypothetical protein HYH03_011091 [Edaphochlamys debaryana]